MRECLSYLKILTNITVITTIVKQSKKQNNKYEVATAPPHKKGNKKILIGINVYDLAPSWSVWVGSDIYTGDFGLKIPAVCKSEPTPPPPPR